MKLLLLHGPAEIASRSKLLSVKEKFDKNNVVIFEEGADPRLILDNILSQSLFIDERLVIIENPPEDFDLELSIDYSSLSIILWFDHEVNSKKSILDFVKKSKGTVLFFSEAKEVSVFPFLDYLAAGDKKSFLEIEKLKKAGFDIQYFLTMVFYLLRNLVVTPKNAPPFVKDKLVRQRRGFDKEKITNMYKQILEIDFKIKSGLLEKSQAEFLLINLF